MEFLFVTVFRKIRRVIAFCMLESGRLCVFLEYYLGLNFVLYLKFIVDVIYFFFLVLLLGKKLNRGFGGNLGRF